MGRWTVSGISMERQERNQSPIGYGMGERSMGVKEGNSLHHTCTPPSLTQMPACERELSVLQ